MIAKQIPTVVITVRNGIRVYEIIIPPNAPEIEAAASKTLTFIGSDGYSTRYSNLGIAALWNAFTDLTGIF